MTGARLCRLWQWLLAYFRLDPEAVCLMSAGRGEHDDYHDYPDSTTPHPWHGYAHVCRRCGKTFYI